MAKIKRKKYDKIKRPVLTIKSSFL